MARQELINELKIRKEEIYSEIKGQFPSLIEELSAIDKIIGSNVDSISDPIVKTNLTTKKHTNGTPKGDMTWIDYVLFILKEIGGKGKSRDVAEAIVNANIDISLKRAINASQDKLSRLLASGKINATKPQSKKDGYLYEIL